MPHPIMVRNPLPYGVSVNVMSVAPTNRPLSVFSIRPSDGWTIVKIRVYSATGLLFTSSSDDFVQSRYRPGCNGLLLLNVIRTDLPFVQLAVKV